jgi:(1->4)-alpha-D-glucan 1-alpha-D-glucosylmutase
VDPDNRRPVDFATARQMLNGNARLERGHPVCEFTGDNMGALKLFVIHRALQFRNVHRKLMDLGSYAPLDASSDHVCAFARIYKQERCLVIVPRLLCTLLKAEEREPIGEVWHDETVSIRSGSDDIRTPDTWRNVFTGEIAHARSDTLRMEEVFSAFPLALLTPEI